jgi:sugar/nucleoside kinase (ribokinase family)
MPLIVTGTVGIDTVHTPHETREGLPGGSCAYFAAAASLQAPVRMVAAVGGDWPAEHARVLESFRNIDLSGLERRPKSRTFAWGGRYFEDMNTRETLFTELGVLEEAGPQVPGHYRDSEFVFLANTHPAEQMRLLEHFPDRRLAVADSMNLWINIAHDELSALLRRLDGFVINDEEAALLTEIANPITAARQILSMGPRFVVVKKGAHGCILVHRDGVATLPAYPAAHEDVIDPTGAGDSFAGGLMAYLARTGRTDFDAIQTALSWGTVTASFTIESFGLERIAGLSIDDVTKRLADFRAAARVGE